MAGSATPLADRRQAGAAYVALLRDQHQVVHQCPTDELGELVGELAELAALSMGQLAAVVADAEARGVVAASQCASTAAWIAEYGWHVRRDAYTIAKAAKLLRRPDLTDVADSVLTVDMDLGTAVVVAGEFDKLAPDLSDEATPVILQQMLAVGAECGPSGVRRLKQELLARYGVEGEFDRHQHRCRRQIDLSAGRETSPGVWDYQLTTDNEGRAVLEAAIGPLSAPRVDKDADGRTVGEPDARPAGRRRGEALIEALRRSVTATHPGTGEPTGNPKAVVMLTLDFETLRAQCGAATVLGTVAEGVLVGWDTVRKLACDAAIIPVVLGAAGEILDQGREQRLFSKAQTRALWLRDQHCTFPACHAPAAWCDAHHLIHWIDGGPTNLDNAALLCGRHHTIAHRDRLAGRLTDHGIEWDQRPGSYHPPDPPPGGRSTPTAPDRPPGPYRPSGRTGATHPSGSRPADGPRPADKSRRANIPPAISKNRRT